MVETLGLTSDVAHDRHNPHNTIADAIENTKIHH